MARVEVSIFRVPESLRELRPQAFSPWLIGLGPIHHFQPELYKVEAFKLAVAKQGLKRFNIPDFGSLVKQLDPLLPRIRACYFPSDLRLLPPTLSWTMAIDGLFLLELISDLNGLNSHLRSLLPLPSDSGERSIAWGMLTVKHIRIAVEWKPPVHSMVVNDIVLLENQIPISILAEAVSYFKPDVYRSLTQDLDSLCSFLSPLPGAINPVNSSSLEELHLPPGHLLEYLYSRTVGTRLSAATIPAVILDPIDNLDIRAEISRHAPTPDRKRMRPTDEHSAFPFGFLRSIVQGEEMEAGSHFKLAAFCGQAPTATQLHLFGRLKFLAKQTGEIRIDFDEENKTIAVPVFKWNHYCEVVVRNLVAYEAMASKNNDDDDLALTQYLHFMHMVIRNTGDVELLMDAGIIVDTPREERHQIRDMFESLCTCRSPKVKGKLLDDGLRPRLIQCDHTYAGVRRYYTRQIKIVVQKYAVVSYIAFCSGLAYLAVGVGGLSLVCGFMKKLFPGGNNNPGADCSSCVANIATFISGS